MGNTLLSTKGCPQIQQQPICLMGNTLLSTKCYPQIQRSSSPLYYILVTGPYCHAGIVKLYSMYSQLKFIGCTLKLKREASLTLFNKHYDLLEFQHCQMVSVKYKTI